MFRGLCYVSRAVLCLEGCVMFRDGRNGRATGVAKFRSEMCQSQTV
jgi:hypothetical protein